MKSSKGSDFNIKWQSQVKKGVLEYVIMLTLKRKSYYGYELIQDVKQNTLMELAEGTIYPLLSRLKDEGLLESRWVEMEAGIPRKYYAITSRGKKQVEQMREFWTGLNSRIHKLDQK